MNGKVTLNVSVLKNLRMSRGLSQEALAHSCEQKRLRVSVATIKRAETGKTVNYRTARELARYFDLDVDALLTESASLHESSTGTGKNEKVSNPKNVITVIWLRLEQRDEISALLNMLENSGSLWQEQIGSVLVATFGNAWRGKQGHLHGQRVMLAVHDFLCEKYGESCRFYSMIHLGECTHIKGKPELSPETLQWFADHSSLAPAGKILVNDELRRLSISHFHYERMDSQGESLWLLGDAFGSDQGLPLIGRATELLQLMSVIEKDRHHSEYPTISHITGPAGIGKTRLLTSVHENARLRDVIVADVDFESGWCDSLELVTNGICRRFHENWDRNYITKSSRYLVQSPNHGLEDVIIISDLLGIEPPELGENDQWRLGMCQEPARIVTVVAELISRLAEESGRSLLISIDNMHLASSQACRLLGEIMRKCAGVPLSCVMTSRSEVNTSGLLHDLSEGLTITSVELGPLSSHDMEVMCEKYKEVDAEYRKRCIELAEGVPLYLLQLLSNFSTRDNELPTSLQLIVEQKLSKVNVVDQRALEFLSVCDAPIPIELLSVLLGDSDYVPDQLLLAQLVKVDLNQRITICHKLVQQVIYQRLGKTKRKECHLALGVCLEKHQEILSDAAPVVLARHFDEGRDFGKSSHYFYKTAVALLKKGMYVEAQEFLDRSLGAIDRCSDENIKKQQITVQSALTGVYKARYGWVSPLVKNTYQKIIALCELHQSEQHLLIAMFGLWSIELMTLDLVAAEKMAEQCMQVARDSECEQGMMYANIALCNTFFWLGRHKEAVQAADNALKLYRVEFIAESIEHFGFDPRSLAGCFGALSASLMGLGDKTEAFCTDMLDTAYELGHGFSLAIALQGAAWLEYHKRDYESTLYYAKKLAMLSEENQFPFYQGVAALFEGWARHKMNNEPDAADFVKNGYHRWLASAGDKIAFSLYSCIVGEILRDTGEWEEATKILNKSIDFAIEHNECCYLSELYRLSADVSQGLKQRNHLKEAIKCAENSPLFMQRITD